MSSNIGAIVKLGLPKGRMESGVFELLKAAGISIRVGARTYRPSISLSSFEVKILKPQNIVEMLHFGSRDMGFAGLDWVTELNADLVELLDTELDPVRVVVAAPKSLLENGKLPVKYNNTEKLSHLNSPSLVVASEYERLTRNWISSSNLRAVFVKTCGATEVFPPEDADCIVDNTATGSTLAANDLEIVENILNSSTKLYANPRAMDNANKRATIEHFVMLLRSVCEARFRVMLELNAPADKVADITSILPAMRRATISQLHGDNGFSIRAAIPRFQLPRLIPELKALGGCDIVVTNISQIVS